jgi:hypothetical protein
MIDLKKTAVLCLLFGGTSGFAYWSVLSVHDAYKTYRAEHATGCVHGQGPVVPCVATDMVGHNPLHERDVQGHPLSTETDSGCKGAGRVALYDDNGVFILCYKR